MSDWFLILLLPLAAWSGWWVAMRKEARDLRADKSRAAYFEGVSFLLNDQTDRAVEAFLHMANVDQQTLDSQLTLGSLFRKRGELDRALHLHQQLYRHNHLSDAQRAAVLCELGEDYNAAGMYAQAQVYFEQLLPADAPPKTVIAQLIRICERTGQFATAITYAEMWQRLGFGDQRREIAHYHCQLAENATDAHSAQTHLQQALRIDSACARAYQLQGQYFLAQKEYVNAIHALQSVGDHALALLPDVLPDLAQAYQALGRMEEYNHWLQNIEKTAKNARLTLALAEHLAATDPTEAQQLLQQRLAEKATPLLLAAYLRVAPAENVLRDLIGTALDPKTVYCCGECGFRQQRLIWHCPACFAWSSFQPVLELPTK